mmetsp:Transcript_27084/g.68027  ORF Transcript_27084/g.68027 Transcript_27084/m.68027 type:complete len:339 (+) Transcript_27084:318-1334(+)
MMFLLHFGVGQQHLSKVRTFPLGKVLEFSGELGGDATKCALGEVQFELRVGELATHTGDLGGQILRRDQPGGHGAQRSERKRRQTTAAAAALLVSRQQVLMLELAQLLGESADTRHGHSVAPNAQSAILHGPVHGAQQQSVLVERLEKHRLTAASTLAALFGCAEQWCGEAQVGSGESAVRIGEQTQLGDGARELCRLVLIQLRETAEALRERGQLRAILLAVGGHLCEALSLRVGLRRRTAQSLLQCAQSLHEALVLVAVVGVAVAVAAAAGVVGQPVAVTEKVGQRQSGAQPRVRGHSSQEARQLATSLLQALLLQRGALLGIAGGHTQTHADAVQ